MSGLVRKYDAESVCRITLIISGSRSGSSWLHEQLRSSGAFITLQGEVSPIRRRWKRSTSNSDLRSLGRAVLAEAGVEASAQPSRLDLLESIDSMVFRLQLQWPDICWDKHRLIANVRSKFSDCAAPPRSWSDYRERVLDAIVAAASSSINRDNYDRGSTLTRGNPTVDTETVVDTPFVIPVPQRPPEPHHLAERPVLLKGPEESRHVKLWLETFPNATVSLIVLTRDPIASINGLIDGWLSNYFHSKHVGSELRIPELVDRGDSGWWKFDAIPDYHRYLRSPLARIACRQWLHGHDGVIKALMLAKTRRDRVEGISVLSYEALLADAANSCAALLNRIGPSSTEGRRALAVPFIMAVDTDPMRHERRRGEIYDAILRERILRKIENHDSIVRMIADDVAPRGSSRASVPAVRENVTVGV